MKQPQQLLSCLCLWLVIEVAIAEPFDPDILFKTKVPRHTSKVNFKKPQKSPNYCDKSLCPSGEKHVGCATQFWGKACPKNRDGLKMEMLMSQILKFVNIRRWKLMKGAVKGLPKAMYLPMVKWNHDLTILAMMVTNSCNYDDASNCANTFNDKSVAQIRDRIEPCDTSIFGGVASKMSDWWLGRFTMTSEDYDTFPADASEEMRRFAHLANDRVNRIGCGINRFTPDSGTPVCLFTCLFNHEIQTGQRVYRQVKSLSTSHSDEDSEIAFQQNSSALPPLPRLLPITLTPP